MKRRQYRMPTLRITSSRSIRNVLGNDAKMPCMAVACGHFITGENAFIVNLIEDAI